MAVTTRGASQKARHCTSYNEVTTLRPSGDAARSFPVPNTTGQPSWIQGLPYPDPFSSNQSASRKVRHGRKETGKIRTENKPPDGERRFG